MRLECRHMSILELLDAVLSTDLTTSEVQRVRSILRDDDRHRRALETPWESSVPDLPSAAPERARSEVDALKDRVALLELTLKLLVEMLAAKGVVDGAALAARSRSLEQEVARLREEDEAWVVCAACHQRVARAAAVRRATGILCEPCHRGARKAEPPATRTIEVQGTGYREATRKVTVEVTEPCVGCGVELTRSEAYRSSRGALCKRCMAEQGDEEE